MVKVNLIWMNNTHARVTWVFIWWLLSHSPDESNKNGEGGVNYVNRFLILSTPSKKLCKAFGSVNKLSDNFDATIAKA